MSTGVLYFRFPKGTAPVPSLNDQAVDDFRELVQIPDGEWDVVCARLNETSEFANDTYLASALENVSDENQRSALRRLINWIFRDDFDDSIRQAARSIKNIAKAEEDDEPVFSEEEHKRALDRIERLLGSSTLCRQAKADRLVRATGQRLESFENICDHRPVFDEMRSNIEGLIPLTTLRLVCERADGLPEALDVVMSESEIDALAEAVGFAQAKLKSLKAFADSTESRIPNTELNTPEKAERDA